MFPDFFYISVLNNTRFIILEFSSPEAFVITSKIIKDDCIPSGKALFLNIKKIPG